MCVLVLGRDGRETYPNPGLVPLGAGGLSFDADGLPFGVVEKPDMSEGYMPSTLHRMIVSLY
jgi:hypothetical protein